MPFLYSFSWCQTSQQVICLPVTDISILFTEISVKLLIRTEALEKSSKIDRLRGETRSKLIHINSTIFIVQEGHSETYHKLKFKREIWSTSTVQFKIMKGWPRQMYSK